MEGSWTEKDDTSSAKFQSEEAGLVDFVGTEEEILSQIRELVCMIPGNNEGNDAYGECEDDLNRDVADAAGITEIPRLSCPCWQMIRTL